MELLLLIVLPICLAVSFLCSGMEAGLFTLGRWRIVQQMREGQLRAARLYRYLEHTENFLWTVLVGNTIALFGAMWITAVALLRAVEYRSGFFWLSYLGSAFLFYMFCDLLPKTLFRKFPNRLCLWLSAPFRVLHVMLSPLVALVETIAGMLLRWTGGKTYQGQAFSNRNELRLLMEDTSAESLTTDERAMLNRVFDLRNISVRQLAIPFARSAGVPADAVIEEVLGRFKEMPQNVLAVFNGNDRRRRVSGFVDAKRLIFREDLKPGDPVTKYMTPPMYLDENVPLNEALRRMQRVGQRIGVVIARDRREIGLINLDEILKFIFGEVKL